MSEANTATSKMTMPAQDSLLKVLTADIACCENKLDGEDKQFWRRAYIRTSYSLIEGFCDLVREKTFHFAATLGDNGRINVTDIYLLSDETYRISNNGKIEPEVQRVPFINRVAFTIRMFAKYANVPLEVFGESGWEQFKKATGVRNRLTHPKSMEDLTITDEDLRVFHIGRDWFYGNVVDVIQRTNILKSDAPLPPPVRRHK